MHALEQLRLVVELDSEAQPLVKVHLRVVHLVVGHVGRTRRVADQAVQIRRVAHEQTRVEVAVPAGRRILGLEADRLASGLGREEDAGAEAAEFGQQRCSVAVEEDVVSVGEQDDLVDVVPVGVQRPTQERDFGVAQVPPCLSQTDDVQLKAAAHHRVSKSLQRARLVAGHRHHQQLLGRHCWPDALVSLHLSDRTATK